MNAPLHRNFGVHGTGPRIDCMSDCGSRCKCAEELAVKWTIRALIFCAGIALFVWLAPVLLRVMQ